jgi:hypothetical protein
VLLRSDDQRKGGQTLPDLNPGRRWDRSYDHWYCSLGPGLGAFCVLRDAWSGAFLRCASINGPVIGLAMQHVLVTNDEIRTVTTLCRSAKRYAGRSLLRSATVSGTKADLAHIAAAITVFEHGRCECGHSPNLATTLLCTAHIPKEGMPTPEQVEQARLRA